MWLEPFRGVYKISKNSKNIIIVLSVFVVFTSWIINNKKKTLLPKWRWLLFLPLSVQWLWPHPWTIQRMPKFCDTRTIISVLMDTNMRKWLKLNYICFLLIKAFIYVAFSIYAVLKPVTVFPAQKALKSETRAQMKLQSLSEARSVTLSMVSPIWWTMLPMKMVSNRRVNISQKYKLITKRSILTTAIFCILDEAMKFTKMCKFNWWTVYMMKQELWINFF